MADDTSNSGSNTNPPGDNKPPDSGNKPVVSTSKNSGPRVQEKLRLHHAFGGGYSDFENEKELLEFVNEASSVKQRKNPDGSMENVYSPNAHLVHGAAHPDYPNLRVEKVSEVVFPDNEDE